MVIPANPTARPIADRMVMYVRRRFMERPNVQTALAGLTATPDIRAMIPDVLQTMHIAHKSTQPDVRMLVQQAKCRNAWITNGRCNLPVLATIHVMSGALHAVIV